MGGSFLFSPFCLRDDGWRASIFLQCARVSILRAEKENGYADFASFFLNVSNSVGSRFSASELSVAKASSRHILESQCFFDQKNRDAARQFSLDEENLAGEAVHSIQGLHALVLQGITIFPDPAQPFVHVTHDFLRSHHPDDMARPEGIAPKLTPPPLSHPYLPPVCDCLDPAHHIPRPPHHPTPPPRTTLPPP